MDAALVRGGDQVVLDLGRVEHFDSAGMGAVIRGIRRARSRGADVRVKGLSGEMLDFFSLVSVDRLTAAEEAAPKKEGLVTWVGARVEPLVASLAWIVSTGVDVVLWPLRGRRWRWDRIAVELEDAFLGVLPIVLLVGFLRPGLRGSQDLIRAIALTSIFGDHRVLSGVDLAVRRGEVFVIMGPSGQWQARVTMELRLRSVPEPRLVIQEEFSAVIPMEGSAPEDSVVALSSGVGRILAEFLERCREEGLLVVAAGPSK